MITKSKIEDCSNKVVQPIQYWIQEDIEIRCCNLKGVKLNGRSTYSSPFILIINHMSKTRSIDVNIPFKKKTCMNIIEIMNDFLETNIDAFDDN